MAKQAFTGDRLKKSTPKKVLKHMLSMNSYIPSLADDTVDSNAAVRLFEELGNGQCGAVYGLLGTTTATKLPNTQVNVSELHTDYAMHVAVYEALQKHDPDHKTSVRVTKPHAWHGPKSRFWAECGLPFVAGVEKFALVSERVFPAPLPVREALVDALLPMNIRRQKQEFLARPENQNCLIRVYLGRSIKLQDRTQNPKLQNFPLHVNEMEALGLDTAHFARLMAKTLAVMHWSAMVDGDDVEFVLGSSPVKTRDLSLVESQGLDMTDTVNIDFEQRSMEMWLIDFHKCSPIQNNKGGIDKLVEAFIHNDPYYPRPPKSVDYNKKLWGVFRNEYLSTSHRFIRGPGPERSDRKLFGLELRRLKLLGLKLLGLKLLGLKLLGLKLLGLKVSDTQLTGPETFIARLESGKGAETIDSLF